MTKRKIGVLVSGRGSNFQAVADKIKNENLPIEIAVVISDSPEDAHQRLLVAASLSVNTTGE